MSKKIPSSSFLGAEFNHLKIIKALPDENGHRKVMALCRCGDVRKYFLDNIKSGKSKSCGCSQVHPVKHGLIKHKLYSVWSTIKNRCYNKNCKSYHRYGGRGVTMHPPWVNDFKAFYDWAISHGWRDGLEIDKDINGSGLSYSPESCSFVTKKQNCNKRNTSKFLTFKGYTKTVSEWSDLTSLSQQVIYKRMKRGWDIEKTLTTKNFSSC